MKRLVIALVILFATAAAEPVGSVDFAGYLSAPSTRLFVLFDSTSKDTSSWLKLGESWRGYRLISYDAHHEVLFVAKGQETRQLKLRSARIVEAGSMPTVLRGSFSAAGDTIIYSSDAELSVGPGWTIRAVSGVMTYNPAERTIRGDFLIDDGARPFLLIAKDGVMNLKDGAPVVRASTMLMQKKAE